MVNARAKQGTEAVSQIRKEVGQDAAIEWRYCDMTDLIQVQEVFSSLCDELPRLDLCILGSGIDQAHFTTDLHCIDAYFGMMWLGHFYASNLLWPLLRRTSRITGAPAPRVIFEAPGQQRSKSVADDSSSDEEDIRRTAYDAEVCSEIFRRSRTSMILGVRHGLAERIAKRHHDNIYAIAVQPSKALSDASSHPRRDSHWQPSDLCDHVLDTLSKDDHFTVRSSSRIVLYAATSSDVENEYLNGAYLVDVVRFLLLFQTWMHPTDEVFSPPGRFRTRKRSSRRSLLGTRFLGYQREGYQGGRWQRRNGTLGPRVGEVTKR